LFETRRSVFALALLLPLVFGQGCSTDSTADEPSAEEVAASEALPVEVEPLARGEIEAVLRYSTNLEAEDAVEVLAEASQKIARLLVEEGRSVSRGQLLVVLYDEEARTALDKVETQLAKAQREHDRQQRLFSQELISEQALNEARYELDRLELERKQARQTLAKTEIRAPISGTVTARNVGVGDYVNVGQTLFSIVDMGSLVARVYVPEKELVRLAPGQTVRVVSPALGGSSYPGVIERISPVVDPASGTVKVTVDLPERPGLRPGMYVDVELVAATHDAALLVPKRALVYDDDQAYVFRVTGEGADAVARRVPVTAVLENKTHVEPAEGFEAGDRLVVAGQAGLKDGAKVSVYRAEGVAGDGGSEAARATR
jgi:membrane fusion protein, multidrug efflux system